MGMSIAKIKDPGYYLRCVADRATQQELGVGRSLAASQIVAYELADGTRLEAGEVKGLRRQVKVAGLRLADGREVALDQVKVLRDGRHVTGYRLADGTEIHREDAKRVTLSRRRVAAYRLADGAELARDQLRAVTAGEAGTGLVDAEGRALSADAVAIRDQGNGRILGYYSEHGEAPGRWIGKGALDDLGLTGLISLTENRQPYERLMAGLDPTTGKRLTQGQPGGERVAGFDLLFTVPKSVSMLWGLTDDPEVRAAVQAGVDEAVQDAFAWLESEVSVVRRGHASSGPNDPYPDTIHHVPTTGLIAALFGHRGTRPGEDCPCGDPHLHYHATVMNLAHGEDGKWNALDAALLYTPAKTVSFVHQAAVRLRVSQRLAALGHHIEWTQPVNGHAEIKGLERRDWIQHFSRRSAEADAALERKGLIDAVGTAPSAARDQAGHETRRAKESGLTTDELVADWRARGLEVGLGPGQVGKALQMGDGQYVEPELTPKLAAALSRELTEQENTFGLLEAIQVVANRARRGITVARAVELGRQLTHGATDQIVALKQEVRTVIRREDGRVVKVRLNDEMAECFTTKEVIGLEVEALAIAKQRRFALAGLASKEAIAAAVAAYDDAHPGAKLGEDQVAMVTGLCTDGAGVALALSPAGHGKTSALRPAKEAWEASGLTVLATAQMAARADELGAGVGLDPEATMTVAALRQRVEGTAEHGGTPLHKGVVLLVDEASVVGLRDLVALERHVRAVDGKLVLAGDPAQLGSIGPGAPLRELPKVVPTYELLENRRQVAEWERDALKDLREGRVGKAVEAYDDHGRIVYAEGESRQAKAALIDRAARDYLSARDSGQTVALMAATHRDRLLLNAAIRPELIRRGEVEADGMTVGKLEIAVGDTLMMLKNNQVPGVRNSNLVQVEQINPKLGTAKVRRADGELVEADHNALAKWAAHGYAETVNKAQGRNVDVGLVLADSAALSSQWGYTAVSRGKSDNRIYFAGPRPVDPEHHLPEEEVPDQDKQRDLLAAGLTRDRSKVLASQVIAALDRDERPAAVAVLEEAVEDSRAMAQQAREREALAEAAAEAARSYKAAEAMRAEEAAKTPEEREADRRRKLDAERAEEARKAQHQGRQRKL